MLNEQQLRSLLVSAFEHLRQQNNALHSLTCEIAAVRDSLCEIGPKYANILDQHRACYVAEAKPLVDDDFRTFDAIIQQLKADRP